ncbi:hypothetical protein VCHENC02_0788B, partial [Vibrio harveyi]
IVVIMLTRR